MPIKVYKLGARVATSLDTVGHVAIEVENVAGVQSTLVARVAGVLGFWSMDASGGVTDPNLVETSDETNCLVPLVQVRLVLVEQSANIVKIEQNILLAVAIEVN